MQTNVRTIHGAFILSGRHLVVRAADGAEWVGPRITSTFYVTETGEIELRTINGGVAYVLPTDLIEVCDYSHPYGGELS